MDGNNGHMSKKFRNDSGSAVRSGGRVSNAFTIWIMLLSGRTQVE